MKTKLLELDLQIKSLSDDGTFEGLLSPYGNVDQGNDLVEPGAFAASLKAFGNVIPMLWQHKDDAPIGDLTLTDQEDGLYCKGKFCLDTDAAGNYLVPDAARAYALLKAKIIKGLSIGYKTVKSQTINGVRHLKELRLFEGSIVTFPMNLDAGINSVKKHEVKDDFSSELTDRQLSDSGYQMMSALSASLSGIPWSGATRAEIVSAAQTTLDQFVAAYMEYLPSYLDYLQREYGLDTKAWSGMREIKEGRKISSATRDTLTAAHEHVKSAFDALDSLLADSEDDTEDGDLEDLDVESDEYKSHLQALKSLSDLLR